LGSGVLELLVPILLIASWLSAQKKAPQEESAPIVS